MNNERDIVNYAYVPGTSGHDYRNNQLSQVRVNYVECRLGESCNTKCRGLAARWRQKQSVQSELGLTALIPFRGVLQQQNAGDRFAIPYEQKQKNALKRGLARFSVSVRTASGGILLLR